MRTPLAAAVLILLAVRLPFLAPTLEDVDSVNFDLGVHDYNPAAHRPHPPGYPLYIVLAQASHAIVPDHATALALLAALFSAVAVVPLYALMKTLTSPAGAALASVFTLFSPLLWMNSVRPMSDLVGFCAATTAQALLLTSGTRAAARWHAVAFLCGAIAGIRLQSLLLTVPLLGYLTLRDRRPVAPTLAALAGGVAAWVVPMVMLMGGPEAAAASFAPVVHDTLNEDSLLPHWTLRTAVVTAHEVLFSPWHDSLLGGVLVALASAGALVLAWTAPRRLVAPLLLFAPYLVFHYVFQDTDTLRYNIPAIPLFAFLASIPLTQWRLRKAAVPIAATAFVAAASATTLPALAVYGATPSPMMQAVGALVSSAASERVVISGHFAFERYLALLPDQLERLPLTRAKEWQSLTDYWTRGRREPILFLREAHRTDHLQFGRDTATTLGHWEWPAPLRPFLKAARPGNIDLVRLDPPRWTIESGAFVTDEAGPYDRVKREPHRLHVQPAPSAQVLMLSGSTDGGRGPVELSLQYGTTVTAPWRSNGFFSLHTLLPPMAADRYQPVSLYATAPVALTDVWVTADNRPAIRPGRGFYLPERDDARVFRWVAAEAHATAYLPSEAALLTIEGWIPTDYYHLPVTLSLRWNGRPLGAMRLDSERFRYQLRVIRGSDGPWNELTISSSHSFVPDDRTKSGDERVLSLRIYQLALTDVTSPARPDQLPRSNSSRGNRSVLMSVSPERSKSGP